MMGMTSIWGMRAISSFGAGAPQPMSQVQALKIEKKCLSKSQHPNRHENFGHGIGTVSHHARWSWFISTANPGQLLTLTTF
jgi:hypothetical protein